MVRGIINQDSGLILPESLRQYQVPIRRLGGWMWPGKYQINIDYRFDGKEDTKTVSLDYFYFGYEGTLLFLGLGIVWMIIIVNILRKVPVKK